MGELPTFNHEQVFWGQDIKMIAGVDEVGVGALAGPVVAGAVVLSSATSISLESESENNISIRDSKTLSVKQREAAAEWIKEHAMAWAVGEASVEEITGINILQASHLAMRRAVESLEVQPDMLLVDGRPVQLCKNIPAVNLIKGDSVSLSIAAASIIAKIHRDNIMRKLGERFPAYGFESHKGYGSAAHMAALAEHGATIHHRPTYAPIRALT